MVVVKTLVFDTVRMLWKFEVYHPSKTVVHRYPHSGIWKARKNRIFCCCRVR